MNRLVLAAATSLALASFGSARAQPAGRAGPQQIAPPPPAPSTEGMSPTPQQQAPAGTDQRMQMLQDFRSTGANLDIPTIPQTGPRADQIRRNLQNIRLPPGFKIDLYAIVPDARHMAVGTNAGVVFVGTRKSNVYAVTDRTRARVADEVKLFAPSVQFKVPNGVCMSRDGILYVVEQNRVLDFPAAEFFYESPDTAVEEVVPQGKLIPTSEQSFNHSARVCRIGPDNKLYVALGQPYNVPPKAKLDLYNQWGIGGIIRMDRDGKNREVFARGVRNSVGIDFDPKTGDLWFTDNQVDGMGDDQPPGELNHATKPGQNFGFPWFGGGKVRTKEYANETPPADVVFPVVEEAPHAADLGMHFYRGGMFPEKYRGAIFSAQHGSWNRTKPVGARVMVTFPDGDGNATASEPFAEGWLNDATGEYSGRPVDVAQLADGSLLVSDDFVGAIYRISYDGPK
ncbi:MAG TPA: PQQ-dependent sugar dehydrogenase [Acetobacteraceae bacterium]|jgi:glucose/arabinose dehydrogenase|nr:PQQ-dependent sugar dehydrogenase [Acetobacteraceae bacterium]